MSKNKLLTYAITLKNEEWKSLRKYVSNEAGRSSELIKLYNHIEKYRSGLNSKHVTVDYVHQHLYRKLERKTVLNLYSKLTMMLQDFLTLQEIKSDQNGYELYKIKALNKRGIYDHADKLGKEILTTLNDESNFHLWHNLHKLAVNHELYFSHNPAKHDKKKGIKLLASCIASIKDLHDNLLQYYNAEAFNREIFYNDDWSALIASNDKSIRDTDNYMMDSLTLLRTFTMEKNEVNYTKLYDFLFNPEISIDQGIAIPIFHRLNKYLLDQLKGGNTDVVFNISDLLYRGIIEGKILYDGKILPHTYLDCVITLCMANEWDKAEEIIALGNKLLSQDVLTPIQAIARMNLLLRKDDTAGVIKIFHNTKFGTVEYNNYAIPLSLRAHYMDLDEDTTFLEHQIRNYGDYLRRHKTKISNGQHKGLYNFLELLKMLVRNHKTEVIEQFINNNKPIYYLSWVKKEILKREEP